MVDFNRQTDGVVLPPAVAAEIWQSTQEASAVMQLATQVPLPGSGVTIPIITGDPEPEWTAETASKPVSRGTVGSKNMTAYTLAVIEPFSNQFRRDLQGLYGALVSRLPGVLAKKFDETVFGTSAPGDNFDTLGGVAAVGMEGYTYGGLIAADQAVSEGGGDLTGWALSPQARGVLLGATDMAHRPLFLDNATSQGDVPNLLGRPVSYSRGAYSSEGGGPNRLGFAGDWSSAMYGVVEGVSIDVNDQATIDDNGTQLNLWQRNMFAVRAEIELGFVVRNEDHFVRLTTSEQPFPDHGGNGGNGGGGDG